MPPPGSLGIDDMELLLLVVLVVDELVDGTVRLLGASGCNNNICTNECHAHHTTVHGTV